MRNSVWFLKEVTMSVLDQAAPETFFCIDRTVELFTYGSSVHTLAGKQISFNVLPLLCDN